MDVDVAATASPDRKEISLPNPINDDPSAGVSTLIDPDQVSNLWTEQTAERGWSEHKNIH